VYEAVVVISVNCETGVKLAGTGFGFVLLVVAVVFLLIRVIRGQPV